MGKETKGAMAKRGNGEPGNTGSLLSFHLPIYPFTLFPFFLPLPLRLRSDTQKG